MSLGHNPSIVTDGLVFYLDPVSPKMWDGSSAIMTSPIGNGKGSLNNVYSADTTSYNVRTLNINSNTTSTSQLTLTTVNLDTLATNYSFTVMFAAQKLYYGLGASSGPGNSSFFNAVFNGYNNGWRIREDTQGTPGTAFTSPHSWGFGFNDQFTSISVNDTASTSRMCICAMIVSPSAITGFVNGITNSIKNPRSYISGSNNPQIGGASAGMSSFNGLLGFMMIYNRPLSINEINQNYNAMRGRYRL